LTKKSATDGRPSDGIRVNCGKPPLMVFDF
jgi:hypothetical protein